jgi:hypothetical protein
MELQVVRVCGILLRKGGGLQPRWGLSPSRVVCLDGTGRRSHRERWDDDEESTLRLVVSEPGLYELHFDEDDLYRAEPPIRVRVPPGEFPTVWVTRITKRLGR